MIAGARRSRGAFVSELSPNVRQNGYAMHNVREPHITDMTTVCRRCLGKADIRHGGISASDPSDRTWKGSFFNGVVRLVVVLVGLIFVFFRLWSKGQSGQREICHLRFLFSRATLASGDVRDAYRANLHLHRTSVAAILPTPLKAQGRATATVPGLAKVQ